MFNKIKKIYAFFRSTFIDQRKYIYLNLELDQFDNSFVRDNEGLNIHLADISDKEKIKADLYPYFDNQQKLSCITSAMHLIKILTAEAQKNKLIYYLIENFYVL